MRSYQVVDFGRPLMGADLPDPRPSGHEAVIAVKAVGVCHSDLHIWEGGYDLGAGRRLMLKDRGIALPLTLGHEAAGEILSVGPKVVDRKVGEMCLVYPWIGCGVCRVCRSGYENLCMKPRCIGVHCDGGYSDQLLVPHSKYLLPLDGLDPAATAPFACSGVTTYSALKKLGPAIKEELVACDRRRRPWADVHRHSQGHGRQGRGGGRHRREAPRCSAGRGRARGVDGSAPDALAKVAAASADPGWAAIDLVGSPATASLAFDCSPRAAR